MDYLLSATTEAIRRIVTADPVVLQTVWASLRFSTASTLLAALLGIPIGVLLATYDFPLRQLVVTTLNTLLAVPTVVVGLFVYALIFREGPLGGMGLLFTPWAIIIGQTMLILPITAALTRTAVEAVDPVYKATAMTLGAGPGRTMWVVLREARLGVLAACGTAYGRVLGEVGVSMMLGGNIAGFTRTITTVIALETQKGEFALALALGMILLSLAFAVNLSVRLWSRRA